MRMSGTTAPISTTSGFNTATAADCVRTSVGTYSITLPLHPHGNTFIPNIITRILTEAGGFYYPTIKLITPTTTTNLTAYVRKMQHRLLMEISFFVLYLNRS